MAFCQMTSYRF